ncbi:glycosyltransferase family 4 protein [Halomonas sp. 25-S5]|uniref:glycosyltransferase family 4 protein n=1 Tax=Halomonas sp. 25-S5 TaxID=2994065 RepID=UPI00246870DB|nr:glycosyltransferase family 4 protein [Halomonas sp. 25-S5]
MHRYYWPDTPPYAAMLRRIVASWRDVGHHVEVLSSQPSYKGELDIAKRPRRDDIDGVSVTRLSLPAEAGRPLTRVVNAIRLGGAVIWRAMTRRPDVIMISTAPPVLGGAAAALAAKLTGARFIYHCMDIHPEVGKVSGEFAHPVVYGVLSRLDNWSCRRADPVVVLSRDMEKTLRQRRGGERLSIEVLNNFSLPAEKVLPDELPFEWSDETFRVLFAGNIGRFQGLDSVVEAMGLLKGRDDIEFVLMGEGVAKEALQRKASEFGARVRFLGHQPVEIAKAAMQRADAGFVSLAAGVYRYAYPSKTMTYLEQGCPLIVAVEPESELASDVVAGGYGHTVPVDDSKALAELLMRLADDRSEAAGMRGRASEKAKDTFSEDVVLKQWVELLQSSEVERE